MVRLNSRNVADLVLIGNCHYRSARSYAGFKLTDVTTGSACTIGSYVHCIVRACKAALKSESYRKNDMKTSESITSVRWLVANSNE